MLGLNYRTEFYHCSYIITISCVRRQISNSILPRDAMRKRGLCRRPLSVRPSVCHVGALYPDGKLLCRPGSAIILVL